MVPDLLSRPFGLAETAYRADPEESPSYVPPEVTLAALEEVALNVVDPEKIASAQKSCPDVRNHKEGNKPKGVIMGDVTYSGVSLYCEVSDGNNPRPLVPKESRSLLLNLLHHQDHPSERETLRRVASSYYWPTYKGDLELPLDSDLPTCPGPPTPRP